MPYVSIFANGNTPKGKTTKSKAPANNTNYTADFQPGQYAKVNADIATKNAPANLARQIVQQKQIKQQQQEQQRQQAITNAKNKAHSPLGIAKGVGNFVKDVAVGTAKAGLRTGEAVSQGIYNAEGKLIGAPSENAQQYTKNLAPGFNKFTDYKGTKKQIAGDVAQTGALVAPEGKIVEKGLTKLVPKVGAKLAEKTAEKTVKGAATKAAISTVNNAPAGAVFGGGQAASNNQNIVKGAETGALFAGAAGAGSLLKSGGEATRVALGKDEGVTKLINDQKIAQASEKAKGRMSLGGKAIEGNNQPTKIPVKTTEGITEKVGTRTPIRPGVKEVSTTTKIPVRTPVKMSDEEYTKQYNKLGNSYDKATKQIADLPPVRQKIMQEHIDQEHQRVLEQLNKDYEKPPLAPKGSPKQLARSTTPAGKTTGGFQMPKESPNVAKLADEKAKFETLRQQNPHQGKMIDEHIANIDKRIADVQKVESKQLPRLVPEPSPELKAIRETPLKSESTPSGDAPTNSQTTSRVYERMKAEHPNLLTDDLSREAITLKDDAEKAVELLAKDKQKAFQIATGQEVSSDVTATSTNIAMAEKARQEGNDKLFNRLIVNRSLAQTRRGQEIVAEKGSITDNSADGYIKELLSIKLDKLGARYLGDVREGLGKSSAKQRTVGTIDKEVTKLEKQIKSNKINTKTALALLDRMECL